MAITKTTFGEYQAQSVEQYKLSNHKGMTVKIITYGATVSSISVPDADGNQKDLVCGFDTLEGYFSPEYRQNAPYFGCTVGRYASRIKDGKFSIDGKEYKLAVNDGSNHLHGGITGFDKQVWEAEALQADGNPTVRMTFRSEHMEEGYPGNVEATVTFTLTQDNELVIDYEGTTDQATPLSLTNHTYFNLSGFEQTIEGHIAKIDASTFLEPDETNVPVGKIADVTGTHADLREGKTLGECFQQLETGFEHFFEQLDFRDFFSLSLHGHKPVNDADAALMGHGNCHVGFRHRVHVGTDDWDSKLDSRDEPSLGFNVRATANRGMLGNQKYIVEGQTNCFFQSHRRLRQV